MNWIPINSNTYNTEGYLWLAYLTNNPDVQLQIKDGHIWSPQDGLIARFRTSSDAIETLREAGYPNQLICVKDTSH